MSPYANEWLDFLARWLHVIAGIVWIGTSFYFVAVDNHLRTPEDSEDARRGVAGEEWEIHGGGFYQVQKYRVAPPRLPEPLHWFKWEAYTTWLSGFALLIVLYYVNARTYLVDPGVADLTPTEAILISIGLLAAAWIVYDALCRAVSSQLVVAVAMIALTTVAAWACSRLFSARASYIQVGAMLGTIMVANVFFVIIPAHHKLLRAMKAGQEPDPAPGIRAKQRSVHNNYLTLPVLFAMLSPHFPSTYGHSYSWLILVVMMLIGAWIRLFFNLRQIGYNVWPIPLTAALAIAGVAIAIRPQSSGGAAALETSRIVPFARAQAIVVERCVPCHSSHPTRTDSAPLGIAFDTPQQIKARADLIEQAAVTTTVMPLGNVTAMTQAERAVLGAWIRQGARIR
ncbi:MAG TPA: urate hydroxylase PuuD [Gaiellaceae bacterium]|nr:urate hydroxylase PuuD [Gaiellaceae bacterium]